MRRQPTRRLGGWTKPSLSTNKHSPNAAGHHPNTLNNLACTYEAAGRLNEAISLHEQALTERRRTLGELHPDTLSSAYNLALAYQATGQFDDANRLRNSEGRPRADP